MNYRKIGNAEVSVLGFGAMRLPLQPDGRTVDEKETDRMIRYAIERGVNYFDTAVPYHDGTSEVVLGKIMSGGLRKKVRIATKQPCWSVEKREDFDALLDGQLEKLKTDHLDFYLLHALFSERWEKVRALDVLEWLERTKLAGKILNYGFSFHDNLDVFRKIMDSHSAWDLCQIQYNYMDEDFQAGTAGYDYAVSKNVPVVVMEPLRGGFLASPPKAIRDVFDEAGLDPVRVAFRWLFFKPGIATVLSGMSSFAQLEHNIDIADERDAVVPADEELRAVEEAKRIYAQKAPIPCTQCGYCMPCPFEVMIPDNIALYDKCVIFDSIDSGKVQYNYHMPDKNKAGACTGCGTCEEKCPQGIPISEWMPKIHAALRFDR